MMAMRDIQPAIFNGDEDANANSGVNAMPNTASCTAMRVAEDKMREDCAFSPKSFRRSAVMMMVESDDVSCVGLSDAVDIDV